MKLLLTHFSKRCTVAIFFCTHCGPMVLSNTCNSEFSTGSKTAAGGTIYKTEWKVLPYRPGRIRRQQKNRK